MASAARATPNLEHEGLTMPVRVDLRTAAARLTALATRFAALAASIADPGAPARGLEWTVSETAVHVLQGIEYYAACIRGETPPMRPLPGETFSAYVARENRAQIDAEPEREPSKIAVRVRASVSDLVDAALDAGPDGRVVFSAGYSQDVTTAVCTMIAEQIVHGHDIAGSTGSRWAIEPADGVLAVYATTAGAPLALDPAAAAGKDIHVRIVLRHGSPFSIRFRDGRVWSEVTGEKPDVHVWADPVAYLMVGFGRWPLRRPLVRGKVLAWGRKPWVMLTVPKMFRSP
jgi:hypothetical protein